MIFTFTLSRVFLILRTNWPTVHVLHFETPAFGPLVSNKVPSLRTSACNFKTEYNNIDRRQATGPKKGPGRCGCPRSSDAVWFANQHLPWVPRIVGSTRTGFQIRYIQYVPCPVGAFCTALPQKTPRQGREATSSRNGIIMTAAAEGRRFLLRCHTDCTLASNHVLYFYYLNETHSK